MSTPLSELDAVGRVAEAFLARYRRGERPSLSEYIATYPELAEQIRDLFPALVVMEELGSAAEVPPRTAPRTGPGKAPEYLGDYHILREVGRGGMGVVYEAVQESLGRHVALKVLSFHRMLPPTLLERFRREARAAARLHHTNIVPVYGVGEHEGVHYYAMQFIPGQSLDDVLKEVKRLRGEKMVVPPGSRKPGADQSQSLAERLLTGCFGPAGPSTSVTQALQRPGNRPERPIPSDPAAPPTAAGAAAGTELTGRSETRYFRGVAEMARQVAGGLDYAHKQGILHRDIKPSNLLLDAQGTVWITDFGLAKAEGADGLTETGDIVGTLRYMAPERFNGSSDPRSDVYALGTTLYEMLTLRPAFDDSSRVRLIEKITHAEPPRPRQLDRSIPRDLETIVLKAIAKEPGRRYQTAAEMADDLGRFLAGEPVRARRVGLWERAVKWGKRRPAVAALLAVSAAAALTLLAGVLVHSAQLDAALQESQDNLGMARRAEREMMLQLAIAQLREAQALRSSGLAGRRFESLGALKTATMHFRALGQLNEERALELRNEVIACLLLADLKPDHERISDPAWTPPLAFDPTMQFYVVRPTAVDEAEEGPADPGVLSIRAVVDDHEVAGLPGFGVRAVGARFSPDGRYLVAHYQPDHQRHSYVWDVARLEVVLKLSPADCEGLPGFSPDGSLLAVPRPDHAIRVYELPSGAVRKDLPPGPKVHSVQFLPDGRRLSVVTGGTVRLRDLEDGKELATFQHPSHVHAVGWRSDGRVFATGCDDHDIYLWDVANPAQPVRTLKGHIGAVVYLAFSQDGDLLLSDSWDSTSRLWDPATGQQLLSKPRSVSREFGPDGQGLEYAWQSAGGRACRTFHGGRFLRRVSIDPAGRLMASVGSEGVQLWNLAANREGDKLLASLPLGRSLSVRFDPKDGSLITDSMRVGLQRWPITPDARTGGLRIGPPEPCILSARVPLQGEDPDFSLSADGQTVAYSPRDGLILLYEPANPRRRLLLEGPGLRHASFSPDGRWVATGNWHGKGARVWDAETGKLVKELEICEPDDGAAYPAFSPNGERLVTGTYAEYRIWEVGTWQEKRRLPRPKAARALGWIVFSPDSRMVAVLHGASDVQLIDPVSGREFARLPAAGCPQCFSPDGSQLVTQGSREGAIQVWDLRLIRRHLKALGLDWDLPAYPPASETAPPLSVQVLEAEPQPPSTARDARAHRERGLLYVNMRWYAKAMQEFKRASDLDPGQSPWEDAVRACTQAIERYPRDAEAYHQRAHARARLG
jgi:serine/threonine protein kinase/WD40 repeat protein